MLNSLNSLSFFLSYNYLKNEVFWNLKLLIDVLILSSCSSSNMLFSLKCFENIFFLDFFNALILNDFDCCLTNNIKLETIRTSTRKITF